MTTSKGCDGVHSLVCDSYFSAWNGFSRLASWNAFSQLASDCMGPVMGTKLVSGAAEQAAGSQGLALF